MIYDTNFILLALNILSWFATFAIYQNCKRYFDAGSVIISSFLLYSCLSLFLYYDEFWSNEFSQLRLFPFIYLYAMIMIAAWPVLRYNQSKIIEVQKPSDVLFKTIALLFIVSTFIGIPTTLPNVSDGLIKILFDSTAGMAIYKDTMDLSAAANINDGKISNLPSIISGLLADIATLMFFYYLTLEKRSRLITLCLLVSVLYPILDQIAISQRGPVLDRLSTIVISYFALIKFIPSGINSKIKLLGITLILAVTIPIAAITVSRFDRPDSSGAISSVLFYSGQSNLFFNNYGLDNGGIRYGDRTFPMFKRMLGFENVPHNFYERRAKYSELKINDEVFTGFVGDFTLDFGPYIPPILFICFTTFILISTRVRNGKILFHQLILLHFVMCICIQGGMKLFSYSDVGNLKIITIFLAYIVFRLDYEVHQERRRKKQLLSLPESTSSAT
jgi:oligosaccharide repeat unit polymerase